MKLLTVLLTVAALFTVAVAPAPAAKAPRRCYTVKINGQRVLIKADGIRCSQAEDIVRNWARHRKRPRGWTCRTTADSNLRYRCYQGTSRQAWGVTGT